MHADHIPLVLSRLPFDGAFPRTGRFGQTDDGWTPERPHLGTDHAMPMRTPILCDVAPHHEVVVHAVHWPGDGWGDGTFGLCLVLDIKRTPYYYLFAHLDHVPPEAQPGKQLTTGQLLALSGNSGLSSGPHLHRQISDTDTFPRDLARNFDPESFLQVAPPAPAKTIEERLAALERIVGGAEAGNYNLLESIQRVQETLSNHKHQTGGPIE